MYIAYSFVKNANVTFPWY